MADEGSDQPTWGPYPGDALAPPPTPPAPEIPMSQGWLWVAGSAIAIRFIVAGVFILVIALLVLGLLVHWL
jgi:hypothetical protein